MRLPTGGSPSGEEGLFITIILTMIDLPKGPSRSPGLGHRILSRDCVAFRRILMHIQPLSKVAKTLYKPEAFLQG